MQRWEYGRLTVYKNGRVLTRTWRGMPFQEGIEDLMNTLGREGWELVTSTNVWGTRGDNDQIDFTFKRPLP